MIDLTIPADDPSPEPRAVPPPQESGSGKLAGYPPKAFCGASVVLDPRDERCNGDDGRALRCGYDVTMDQLDTRGTYVERTSEQAIAAYVAQIAACHLFVYVSTESYENDAQRKWLLAERTVALQEAAELRIRLAAVVMHDTLDPADRFADLIIDGRSALSDVRTADGTRSGDTGEMQGRLLTAGLGYSGPTLDPPLKARLAEIIETVTGDLVHGRLRHAERTLSSSHEALGVTEEWQLLSARLLAAGGARGHAAGLAENLLKASTVQHPDQAGGLSIARRQHRGHLACDSCSAFYTPYAGAVTVICEACGGHGAVHGDGCIFCGSERRFVCDRASAGRPCPICGVGSVRWS